MTAVVEDILKEDIERHKREVEVVTEKDNVFNTSFMQYMTLDLLSVTMN